MQNSWNIEKKLVSISQAQTTYAIEYSKTSVYNEERIATTCAKRRYHIAKTALLQRCLERTMKCQESGNIDSMSYMRIHIWLGNPQKRIHLICVLFQMWCSMQPRRSKSHSIGTRFCQLCRPKCCILGVVELEFLIHPFFKKGNKRLQKNKLI